MTYLNKLKSPIDLYGDLLNEILCHYVNSFFFEEFLLVINGLQANGRGGI